jgi:catechol 2,3-dioxygenase-like lactoylglutathione lyase family enzyme
MSAEINGIAHIQLTVNDLKACMTFYELLLNFMGMTTVMKGPKGLYCVGSRTAIGVTRSAADKRDARFDQRQIGLHHLCLRARSAEDVDKVYAFLKEQGAQVVHAPEEGPWAKGYYSLLFEDPDGIRLEVNHVPGKGNLDPSVKLPIETLPGYEDYEDA